MKTMPTPYSPAAGSVKSERGGFAAEELVRDLDQQARAVAGFGIAAAGAAMRQVDQNLNAFFDNVVRFDTLDIGDKAHAAGVVFIAGMVESLRLGEPVIRFRSRCCTECRHNLASPGGQFSQY